MQFDKQTYDILAKALGIADLPEADRMELLERAGVLIYQAVITRAMEEMTDEQVDEFEKFVDTGEPTPETMLMFFRSKIQSFDMMIDDEARKYIEFTQKMMAE